ncbi:hypothetical protein QREC_QR7375_04946 (plasmid) [Escherichia coli]|nr:hypothetical protein QREC_QR7375_04946 [Escherichia coli]
MILTTQSEILKFVSYLAFESIMNFNKFWYTLLFDKQNKPSI